MSYFKEEIQKTINDIQGSLEPGDLCFAMLCDSHMSEQGQDTCKNISAVDKEVGFDFIVHLGNIINGDNPRRVSGYLLNMEIERYKNSIEQKKLFAVQGYTDGWRDERFAGQLCQFMITDEMWYSATAYIDRYDGVSRPGKKPYYYVDLPGKDIRLIFLCTYSYQIDTRLGLYEKYLCIDVQQQGWLMTEALCGCKGKTVLIFSHRIPKSRFETGRDPYFYEGQSTEPVMAIIQQAQMKGVHVACWFGGGYGYDCEMSIGGIHFTVINSQLPKLNTNSKCDGVRFAENRSLNTINQDCWDAVLVKNKKKQIEIYRFGCGNDRVL